MMAFRRLFTEADPAVLKVSRYPLAALKRVVERVNIPDSSSKLIKDRRGAE